MALQASVLAVSKDDITQCVSVTISTALPSLGPSSVRVQTKLVSMTSNNLSYARNGTLFHWWDAYPIPSDAPAPYDDPSRWGIVPVWGFGEIVETTIGTLKPGALLYGFWPMSKLPVDLMLEGLEPRGHWKEISGQRKTLMSIYNRYIEIDQDLLTDQEKQAWYASLMPPFGAGHLINRYVFPGAPDAPSALQQHPLGTGLPWTVDDADLSSAVLVSLSAATKTARGLASQIVQYRDRAGSGPLSFLQVTRSPEGLMTSNIASDRVLGYDELDHPATLTWLAALKPKRVVLLDFGVPFQVIEAFKRVIESSGLFDPLPTFTMIGIGSEMRVLSQEETQARMASGQSLGRIQFNTSTLRDRAIETEGAQNYFQNVHDSFDRWLKFEKPKDLEICWGTSIAGKDGMEGLWRDLCSGQVSPQKACVFKL